MAFRRRFRRGFGRRRGRRTPETYTILECSRCQNVAGDMTCTNPLVDSILLMSMGQVKSPVLTSTVTDASDKWLVVDGIKFEVEYFANPADAQQCTETPQQDVNLVSMFLKIWEAIVVLPLAQASDQAPAYLPNLTVAAQQNGDLADRVLWKRISSLPWWGLSLGNNIFPQLTETNRDFGHGPVVVKSKVKLDDRHGLYYVRNYVHNVFWGFPPRASCTIDCEGDPNSPIIPVLNDDWFKIFYHTRK